MAKGREQLVVLVERLLVVREKVGVRQRHINKKKTCVGFSAKIQIMTYGAQCRLTATTQRVTTSTHDRRQSIQTADRRLRRLEPARTAKKKQHRPGRRMPTITADSLTALSPITGLPGAAENRARSPPSGQRSTGSGTSGRMGPRVTHNRQKQIAPRESGAGHEQHVPSQSPTSVDAHSPASYRPGLQPGRPTTAHAPGITACRGATIAHSFADRPPCGGRRGQRQTVAHR